MGAKLFFAWVENGDVAFSAPTHAREDLPVLSLRISQSEGEFATATVETENPGLGLLAAGRQQWALISASESGDPGDAELLFRGRVLALPSSLAGPTIELEFVAEPEDSEDKLRAFAEPLKVLPYYDYLYVPEGSEDDPNEVLEARGALFDFDRKTHAISLTDFLEGERVIDVGDRHDRDAFSLSPGEPPVSRARMLVSCEWEQRARGICVLPTGRGEFRGIATCTPHTLEASVPERGAGIGANSGWTVESSELRLTGLSEGPWMRTGYLVDVTDEFGNVIWQEPEEGQLDVAHYSLDQFFARFDYRQSRREQAELVLDASSQPVLGAVREQRLEDVALGDLLADTVTPHWQPNTFYNIGDKVKWNGGVWKCNFDHWSAATWGQDFIETAYTGGQGYKYFYGHRINWFATETQAPLGDSRRWSYFDTERGRRSLEHGLLRLRAFLRSRLRCVDVRLLGSWEDLADVSCRDSVRFTHPGLPGGGAVGKVAGYEMVWSGDGERYVEVSLGVSTGTGDTLPVAEIGEPTWVSDDWVEIGYAARTGAQSAVDDIVYELEAADPVVHVNPFALSSPLYSVLQFEIKNRADVQLAAAARLGRSGGIADEAVVARPTKLTLRLRDISGEDTLVREYTVSGQPIVGPRGIDLESAA